MTIGAFSTADFNSSNEQLLAAVEREAMLAEYRDATNLLSAVAEFETGLRAEARVGNNVKLSAAATAHNAEKQDANTLKQSWRTQAVQTPVSKSGASVFGNRANNRDAAESNNNRAKPKLK